MTQPRGPRDDRYAKGSLRGKKKVLVGPPVLGRKFCRDCGRWRLLSDFGVRTRTSKGVPIYWNPSCRTCVRFYIRELHTDPVRRATRAERQREDVAARRRAMGIPPRQFKKPRQINPTRAEVDNEPLRRAFEESGMSIQQLAKAAGYVYEGGMVDTIRVKRMLGLLDQQGTYYRRISYDNAVRLVKAMDIDPVSVGV